MLICLCFKVQIYGKLLENQNKILKTIIKSHDLS